MNPIQPTAATFRMLRESMGFTVTALARHWSITPAAVSSWESGRLAIPTNRWQQLLTLEATFQQTVDDLIEITRSSGALQVPATDSESPDEYPAGWHRAAAAVVWQNTRVPVTYTNQGTHHEQHRAGA